MIVQSKSRRALAAVLFVLMITASNADVDVVVPAHAAPVTITLA